MYDKPEGCLYMSLASFGSIVAKTSAQCTMKNCLQKLSAVYNIQFHLHFKFQWTPKDDLAALKISGESLHTVFCGLCFIAHLSSCMHALQYCFIASLHFGMYR